MERILKLMMLLTLATLFPAAVQAQSAVNDASLQGLPQLAQLDSVAAMGLQTLQQAVNVNPTANLGLSPGDAAQATLGVPFLFDTVRLDLLQAYGGQNPTSVMTTDFKVVYPVEVASQVRIDMTLGWTGSAWKMTALGSGPLAIRFDAVRTAVSQQTGMTMDKLFMVRIPTLFRQFVAYFDSSSNLILVPDLDDPPSGLQKGVALPATQAFAQLVPEANAMPVTAYHIVPTQVPTPIPTINIP
jgi:hypothetical protein